MAARRAGGIVVYQTQMSHWPFVGAAYVLVAAVLLGYWQRTERRIRALERAADQGDA